MNAALTHFDCNFRPDATGVLRVAALANDLNSSPKDWVAALSSVPDLSGRMLAGFQCELWGFVRAHRLDPACHCGARIQHREDAGFAPGAAIHFDGALIRAC